MVMGKRAPVFDEILQDYLSQITIKKDGPRKAAILGIHIEEDNYRIPFFNRVYTLTPTGITDDHGEMHHHAINVILCKYLLLCPVPGTGDSSPGGSELVTYKDFRDAAPYAGGFMSSAEQPIAGYFEGKIEKFQERCRRLGGELFDTDVACQCAYKFSALPKVPIYLMFNDADEDFPADCTLLFQRDAANYLDMECIAMVGSVLAVWLKES
ncbi:MAG: DUF3786 domain-containing protein [Desulfobacteraceae bacterium]|nr:DUF3786 domain-containing protein [Desulfobacteraceae bacterium]